MCECFWNNRLKPFFWVIWPINLTQNDSKEWFILELNIAHSVEIMGDTSCLLKYWQEKCRHRCAPVSEACVQMPMQLLTAVIWLHCRVSMTIKGRMHKTSSTSICLKEDMQPWLKLSVPKRARRKTLESSRKDFAFHFYPRETPTSP